MDAVEWLRKPGTPVPAPGNGRHCGQESGILPRPSAPAHPIATCLAQHDAHLLKDDIAGRMAMLVVDRLEVIQIHHEDARIDVAIAF